MVHIETMHSSECVVDFTYCIDCMPQRFKNVKNIILAKRDDHLKNTVSSPTLKTDRGVREIAWS